MTTTAETTKTVQMYRVSIKATPQAIWNAITKPEWTEKYGYALCRQKIKNGQAAARQYS